MSQSEFDITIEPGKSDGQYWLDIWHFRELLMFLTWRDILVRYKQTAIGILWSLLRPLLTMLAFVLVFQKVANLDSGGTPYPILVLAGLLPWQLFSVALSDSSNSLVSNSNLISKVYFPRLLVPLSSIFVCLIDFLITLALLFALMIYYGYFPAGKILFLPLFLLLVLGMSAGVGFWLSAMNVKYRDFRYVIPFVVQFGLYVSPVGFSSDVIPQKWRVLYSINPMVGAIDGFRWCVLTEVETIYVPGIVLSVAVTILSLIYGIWYFRKTEKTFADRI